MSTQAPVSVQLKKGQTLTIRSPQESDAEGLIEFVKEVSRDSQYLLSSESDFSMPVEQEVNWINSNNKYPGQIVLLGEVDAKIVSITNAGRGKRQRNAHIALLGTSVAKNYRGQGIGRLTMNNLCQWAVRKKGLEYLELSVMTDNHVAQKLYKSLGFEVIARVPKAFRYEDGSYQENIVMRLGVMGEE